MGKPERNFTRAAFTGAASAATAGGSRTATARSEQEFRTTKKLNPLVDPKGYGVIRRSISWLEPAGKGKFTLLRGTAMLIENLLDTTNSMGSNVDRAMKVIPDLYDLFKHEQWPILGRYDPDMITAIFGDIQDDGPVLCRSQAEHDARIAEQLALMVPNRDGGDEAEDPDYGLFGAAYLTDSSAVKLGLKTYHFTVTDAPGRGTIDYGILKKVYGDEVLQIVSDNGRQMKAGKLPTTDVIVRDLLKIAHAFVIQVEEASSTTRFWKRLYGEGRVIMIPDVSMLPAVQAAIIGLTEGVLNLQSVVKFLTECAGLSKSAAERVKLLLAGIDIGAQSRLPNFDIIPLKGDMFAKKGDVWPIGRDADGKPLGGNPEGGPKHPVEPGGKVWL